MNEKLAPHRPRDPAFAGLIGIAERLRVEDLVRDIHELGRKIDDGRYYVACVGQFKRGKSTLINALVGDPMLPIGVAPVTSVVTVVRFGPTRAARVRIGAEGWRECAPREVAQYVSEAQNPANRRGVTGIEVMTPSSLLGSGMCLVDTPGLGSVIEANTKTTADFVPYVDAALVVLGADPPITGEELRFVVELGRRVRRLVFVLNKVDRLTAAEALEAARFSMRVLDQALGRPIGDMYQVSAREVAERGPTRDWSRLVEALARLADESGATLLEESRRRALGFLAERLAEETDERLDALGRPAAESMAKVLRLKVAIADAERALDDLGPLFRAEQERLGRALTRAREEFFVRALPAASIELKEQIRQNFRVSAPRERAMALAMDIAERWLDRWKSEKGSEVDGMYAQGAARFVEIARTLEARLAGTVAMRIPPVFDLPSALQGESQYHFTELWTAVPTSAGRRLLDIVGPRRRRLRSIEEDAVLYLGRLFEVNSARVRDDFQQQIGASRQALEETIRRRLRAIVDTTERGVQEADEARSRGQAALQSRWTELSHIRAAIDGITADAGIRPHARRGATP
jgi:Dynamin family